MSWKRPNDIGSQPISRSVSAVSHAICVVRGREEKQSDRIATACTTVSDKCKGYHFSTPLLFQHVFCIGSQAFRFHLPRKFSVVT